MLVRNFTPLVPLLFPVRTAEGRDRWVFALRSAFRLAGGGRLELHDDQPAVVRSDLFHGAPGQSSVFLESDLVPLKPRTNIHVTASAKAPGGRPAAAWRVRVRVGVLEKTLRVTGPRRWVRANGRYSLTEPEPCLEVPIRYELAYGGTHMRPDGTQDRFEENPVGLGYVGEQSDIDADEIKAPQIECPGDPIDKLEARHSPRGFGPILRSWLPRRALAGTFDARWRRERWPELPLDFSEEYFNGSHPDLLYPGYLDGGEPVTLEGMSEGGPVEFAVPALALRVFAEGRRRMQACALRLDTLHIDLERQLVHAVWRGAVDDTGDIKRFEAHGFRSEGEHGGP